MNGKIVPLLLACVVALSIVYSCSGSSLSSYPAQSIEAVRSGPSNIIEKPCQNAKLSIQEMGLHIMGDPIDDPTPN